jgi:hypothetical protein
MEPIFLTDSAFSRRLERAEGRASSRYIDAISRTVPGSRAEWLEVAGAYVLFDHPQSPISQTFGLGLSGMPTSDEMSRIEDFFAERGAPVFHEVSPLADPAMLPLLHQRGYHPVELTTLLYQPLQGREWPTMEGVRVRLADPSECELWARTACDAWSDSVDLGESLYDLLRVSGRAEGTRMYFAEIEGRPVATGCLNIQDGVALLAGAATLPGWRNRGAQRALLQYRLSDAVTAACDLAIMGAAPGSASQRNAQRNGFQIAYTRIKWVREKSS